MNYEYLYESRENSAARRIKTIFAALITACVLISAAIPIMAGEGQLRSNETREELSHHLESIAEKLSVSLAAKDSRSFLTSQLVASPKIDALVLRDYLVESARQRQNNHVEGLYTLDKSVRAAESILSAAAISTPRIDILLPAMDDRKMLNKAGEVYVAVDPLIDEKEVKSITAYSNGKRITLDADVSPKVPTFVISPAVSESLEPSYPLLTVENPSEEKEKARIVDDFVGLPYIRISNDHEPWYRGDPEIVVRYRRFLRTGVFQDLQRNLPSVNDENRWYFLGDPNSTYLFFDSRWDSTYEMIVWEEDSVDSDDVVGIFIINWPNLPFGGYTSRSNKDAQIRLDKD